MVTVALLCLTAATRQPAVVGLAGTYGPAYSRAVGSLGATVVILDDAQLARPEALQRLDALIVSHFRDGRWPQGAEQAVAEYVVGGGRALLEIAALPPRQLLGRQGEVSGWAPTIRVVDPDRALLAAYDRGKRLRYGAWGCGLKLPADTPARVVARWDMSDRDTYSHTIADGFADCDVAMVELRAGRGRLWWSGAETLLINPSIVRRWLAEVVGEEKLPLLGVEKAWAAGAGDVPPRAGQGVVVYADEHAPHPGLPDGAGAWIARRLAATGFAVETVDTQALCSGEWLRPENGVLVLAQGEAFPVEALEHLRRFLASGGGLVSCAGLPLRRLLVRRGNGWADLARWIEPDHAAFTVATATGIVAKAYEFDQPVALAAPLSGRAVRAPVAFAAGRAVGVFFPSNGWAPETYGVGLLVGFSADGTPLGCPATLTVGVGRFQRARWLAVGFYGEGHPFRPGAGQWAGEMLASFVRLVQPRNFAYVADVWPHEVLYRPGETVEVTVVVAAQGWRRVEGRCELVISERDTGREVFRDEQPFTVEPGDVAELAFRWPRAPLRSWAYRITARVAPALPGLATASGAFLAMAPGAKVDAPDVYVDGAGRSVVGGRHVRLTGVNLYTADTRGVGWFFSPPNRVGRHLAVDAFDRDLSYVRLAGGNATRTHYFELVLTPDDFDRPGSHGMRRLDGYLLLHARHGMAAVFAPLTFWPGKPAAWRKYWPADADPYADERCLAVQERYFRAFAGYCARRGAGNILWQLINEPEGRYRAPTGADAAVRKQYAERVRRWAERMRRAVVSAGYRQAGMGHVTGPFSEIWDPRGNLRGLQFHDVHHYGPRTLLARSGEPKWSIPFGLNYSHPATVGEYGQPNAANSDSVVFGRWTVPYDQTLHCVLGENALGFFNFYLANPATYPRNPEWGMVRPDRTDKPCGRLWRRWNWLSRHIAPDEFLPPRWAIVFDDQMRLADGDVLRKVFAAYVALMREGVYARLLSAGDLEAATAASRRLPARAVVVGRLGPQARAAVARAEALGTEVCREASEMVRRCQRELPVRLGKSRATFTYVRPLRGRRWFVCLLDAPGEPVEFEALGRRWRLVLPKGRCATLVIGADGSPELVEAAGRVELDGKLLVDGPAEGYVVAAGRGGSLLTDPRVEVFAENQRAVRAAFELPDDMARRRWSVVGRGRMGQELAAAVEERMKAAGLKVGPGGDGTVVVCGPDWPEADHVLKRHGIRAVDYGGRRALVIRGAVADWPWAAAILAEPSGGRPVVYLVSTTPAGIIGAAAKAASLRVLGDYCVAPFMELAAVWKTPERGGEHG